MIWTKLPSVDVGIAREPLGRQAFRFPSQRISGGYIGGLFPICFAVKLTESSSNFVELFRY